MSSNRCRNIYTLGNISLKENLKRRQQTDPFEKDPFKIQSYNFRYAERPSFPVAPLQPRINNANKPNDCQTFFYNRGFSNTNANKGSQNDERILNPTNFQEYRRRKYLQATLPSCSKDNTQVKPLKSYESKILNLYNNNQKSKCSPSLIMKPTCMQTTKNISTFKNLENNTLTRIPPIISSPLSNVYLKPTRGSNSGCEININIQKLEDKPLQDNVNIKIETDSIYKNLNLNSGKSQITFKHKNNNLQRYKSSDTFVLDKNLSNNTLKYQESQKLLGKMDTKRIKELTAIYSSSSQVLQKTTTKRIIKSNERFPSRLPLGLNNSYTSPNDNYQFNRSNSIIEKSRNNKLQNNTYNNLNSATKRVSSTKQTPFYASRHSLPGTLNRTEFKTNLPLHMANDAKLLPINVNINVYADKLKLLRV